MQRHFFLAAQVYTATSSARPALRPPSDLNELEREVFADIVLGCGPHHFVPVDVPLIAILAKNIVLERIAFGELRAAGYRSDKQSPPWLAILQHASKDAGLATVK